MRNHVLILSCGAKVSLLRAFNAAARSRGARIYAADLMDIAPALQEADERIHLPAWHADDFGDALQKACEVHRIGLLVPTADGELLPLSQVAEALRASGTHVLLPAADALAICQDKQRFVTYCRAQGFPVPTTYGETVPWDAYPVYVRPRTAQGGAGAQRVNTPALLAALRSETPDLLVQAFLDIPEYSVDLLMDLDGQKALQAVPRRRLQVYGGEAQVSQTERHDELAELAMQLGESLGLVGHNVVQAFYSPVHGVRLIEVNPRFGGASILGIQAGLDSPGRLLDLLRGDTAARARRDIHYGLLLQRYGEDRFIDSR